MATELSNKYIDIKMTAKGGAIFSTLQVALNISKASNCRLSLSFPRGYSIDIYPDSTINDLQTIEELTNSNYGLREKVKELETK